MKKYIITAMHGLEPMNLPSTRKEYFESENLEEARKAYEEEIKELAASYRSINDLGYEPTDEEVEHKGIVVSLDCHILDEDGDLVDNESIETSGYYFDKFEA